MIHDSSESPHLSKDSDALEEHIAKLKTIVYKTIVDSSTMKLIGEKEKLKLFKKIGFLRAKSDEVQFDSLERFYEPYITVNGRYHVDYYRRRVYILEIEDDVSELVVFNHVLKPKISALGKMQRKPGKVQLEAEQRIVKENSAYMIFNRKGREVPVEELPAAPAEENPEEILAEAGEKVWRLEVPPEKAVEKVKSRVVDRPKDAARTASESFEVSEYTIVYSPVYQITYKNVKTDQTRSLLVSGVTSKVIERTG
jgi:hypothetical protein